MRDNQQLITDISPIGYADNDPMACVGIRCMFCRKISKKWVAHNYIYNDVHFHTQTCNTPECIATMCDMVAECIATNNFTVEHFRGGINMKDEDILREILLPLIAEESTREQAHPQAITKIVETRFFSSYNNLFDGWFLDVKYSDGIYEIWFVVDLRSECLDEEWFLENVRSPGEVLTQQKVLTLEEQSSKKRQYFFAAVNTLPYKHIYLQLYLNFCILLSGYR